MQYDETGDDNASAMPPPLKLDADEYLDKLADYDLSDEQKRELLQSLWHIMSVVVDIGFGLDPVQMVFAPFLENSGSDNTHAEITGGISVNMLEQNSRQNFNQSALQEQGGKGTSHE